MKTRYKIAALAGVLALALTGCSNNAENEGGTKPDASKAPVAEIKADDAAVALLPESVKSAGKLVGGTDAAYPPNEYKDDKGQPTGWGIELTEAIAAKLGLKVEWQILPFDSIIPRIQEGAVDIGSSSFTDNVERQASVTFVNYLNAGTLWAAPKGSKVDPNDACGLTVAVQQGTIQQTDELTKKSKACTDAGKKAIEVLPFKDQPEATNAVVLGKADAFSADMPVTVDAINQTGDKLQQVGEVFDSAPYGFALKKDGELTKAVQAALQSLMDDGTYLKILTNAGFESGAIKEATINAGTE